MNQLPKEGAGRPLYTSAPVLPAKQPETEGKPPSFWQSLPRRRVFLAAAAASYLYGYYYVQRSLPGLNADWSARVFWPLFAAAFLLGVSAFAQALGRAGSRNARFWAFCWLAQSAALALWNPHGSDWDIWQVLAWHLTAVYWVLARTGMQAAGKANAMILLDGVAGLITLPFGQFFLRLRIMWGAVSAAVGGWRAKTGASISNAMRRRAAELAFGVLLAAGLALLAAGELRGADANFAALLDQWRRFFHWPAFGQAFWEEAFRQVFWFCFSLPVSAWLFGLAGGALRRQTPPVTEQKAYELLGLAPRLPALTGQIAVAGLCGVYALFFAVQLAEYAAALGLPLAPAVASGFAVEGFWSLCRVLVLNFAVLATVHFFGARPADAPGRQRVLLAAFGVFGLGFAVLAAVKLGVYTELYGLTPRRILSAWVITVLLLGCVLAGVRLFRRIPAARILIAALALSFSLLCCADIEGVCLRDHLHRLETGVAEQVDWDLVHRCVTVDRDRLAPVAAEALRDLPLSAEDQALLWEQAWRIDDSYNR